MKPNSYWQDDDYRNDEYNSRDIERDTFDALTDGMYGDYEDWVDGGGNMDSLKDELGY